MDPKQSGMEPIGVVSKFMFTDRPLEFMTVEIYCTSRARASRVREHPSHRPRATLCEKPEGFVQCQTPRHHHHKTGKAAIPMQTAHLDRKTYCHSALNLAKITCAQH